VQTENNFAAQNLPSDGSAETERGHSAHEKEIDHEDGESPLSVCLVGPGWRFTSGISYYTCRLANSMASDQCETSVILIRRLLPRLLYPGRLRVGLKRASMKYRPDVSVYDGVDWWWGTSLLQAVRFLRARKSKVLLLEWWTAATLHTYLLLAIAARAAGMRVVIELHELQDPGEAGFALARGYGHWGLRALLRLAHGCIVHSKADWHLFESGYGPIDVRVALVPHGPYDQYGEVAESDDPAIAAAISAVQSAPKDGVVNLLFFGLIRPYKGLEDLLRVFNALPREEAERLWLTVVGETWEGCTEPAQLIAASPHADRITFVNEYVPDEVVGAAFAHADVVVLPYRRSSSSGILHVAMSWGLPIVVTSVGGLPEAASGYAGAVFVPPEAPALLKEGLTKAAALAGQKFADPRSWHDTVEAVRQAASVGEPQRLPSQLSAAAYPVRPGADRSAPPAPPAPPARPGPPAPSARRDQALVDDDVRRHVVLVRPLADPAQRDRPQLDQPVERGEMIGERPVGTAEAGEPVSVPEQPVPPREDVEPVARPALRCRLLLQPELGGDPLHLGLLPHMRGRQWRPGEVIAEVGDERFLLGIRQVAPRRGDHPGRPEGVLLLGSGQNKQPEALALA
jgi:glycosyltransferase involved in cell wall biosynthesis